ncbi:hypothetical protein GCM10010246_05990 [Streptomyces cuspidosporus]|uniref:AB hydrolase-1 domain-containing protein n=1 Tax=Streptomyces cuspidosporus TaxID=66882 RepID=A0ABN3FCZ6_9ACTN
MVRSNSARPNSRSSRRICWLTLDRFHLVGHSLGAVVATATAGLHPGMVLSLTAHAGWIKADARMVFQFELWKRLALTDPAALARLLLLTAMGKDTLHAWGVAEFEQMAAAFTGLLEGAGEGVARQAAANMTLDIAEFLPSVSAPTLIIASGDDRVLPPPHQHDLADRIPHARLLRVPGGHGLPGRDPCPDPGRRDIVRGAKSGHRGGVLRCSG